MFYRFLNLAYITAAKPFDSPAFIASQLTRQLSTSIQRNTQAYVFMKQKKYTSGEGAKPGYKLLLAKLKIMWAPSAKNGCPKLINNYKILKLFGINYSKVPTL